MPSAISFSLDDMLYYFKRVCPFGKTPQLFVDDVISVDALHNAARYGWFDDAVQILERKPEYARALNKQGVTPLHQACRAGHLKIAKRLVEMNKELCFLEDIYGRTALHVAAMEGRLDVVQLLLNACPESVTEVTATGHTCLHTAVVYNKFKVIQYLLKWLGESPHYDYASQIINAKDIGGNTALHLATSRKQLQTLKLFLTSNTRISHLVDVNAMNSGGITALDIVDVLPYCGKIDMEIDKLLRQARAKRARDIASHDACFICVKEFHQPSPKNTLKDIIKLKREFANCVLLLTATMIATITYVALLSPLVRTSKAGYLHNNDANGTLQLIKGNSIATSSFIFFNSTGFVASVAMLIFLLREFPLKPWPQITVSTLFSSYMCRVMVISPNEAWPLLLLAIPFLLLAAAGKIYGFARERPCESSCYVIV
ncbi:hypothetical protein F0562_031446 [Nyssa sinensis]|uniref:PGG domain-containing protein n=1 Tax=Nyssa sinensis TaxID=561372 RepID=A0A5J5AU66_9ASTE|nr:hypothetical protein F0562_031446 [Nyssa sinensis]